MPRRQRLRQSAPSSLPAEDATTNSLPAHSSEAVLPASAVEVPDQVMSEGASSALDAAVRLSMKRSSDSSHSESETERLHADHSTRDVVMLLNDSDVGRAAVEQCREVCRRGETFLVDVNDWDCQFRDKLRACGSDGSTVACSSGGTTRELMSNESCLVDLLAAARNGNGNLQRKTIGKCVRQQRRERLHRQDGSLRRCPTIRCCGERSPSTRGPMTLLSYVLGGLPRSSVVVAVTNTSTSQRHLTYRKPKL